MKEQMYLVTLKDGKATVEVVEGKVTVERLKELTENTDTHYYGKMSEEAATRLGQYYEQDFVKPEPLQAKVTFPIQKQTLKYA